MKEMKMKGKMKINVTRMVAGMMVIFAIIADFGCNSYAYTDESNSYVSTYNDALTRAVQVNLVTPYRKTFSEGNNIHYYKINITEPGKYRFYNKDIDIERSWGAFDSDIYCKIYDEDGAMMECMKTDMGTEKTYLVPFKKGTYYFSISSHDIKSFGTYIFSVIKEEDISDEVSGAQTILLNKDYTGDIANGYLDDKDYFKINAKKAGKYRLSCKNIDMYEATFSIYDKDEALLSSSTIGSAGTKDITLKLKKGVNYILVNGNEGKYKFSIKCLSDISDTKKNAKTIKVSKKKNTSVLYGCKDGDIDYYKIKFSSTKTHKMTFKNINVNGNVKYTVIKKSGKQVEEINVYKGQSYKTKLKLKKGTYYICVSTGENLEDGKYSFIIR
ncbi:MAG: hypothetical protein K6F55_11685 [Eubacterium sp.]|nr:hypothetical protein [Eubacterium sp.]